MPLAWTILRGHWLEVAIAVFGGFVVVRSIRGAIARKLTSYGRGGRPRTYVGADAVREGIFQAVVGLVFVLLSVYVVLTSISN
jgi:cell division ATPase FtsA